MIYFAVATILFFLALLPSDRHSSVLQVMVALFGIAVIALHEMMFNPWLADVFW
jgi:hypothetical protein